MLGDWKSVARKPVYQMMGFPGHGDAFTELHPQKHGPPGVAMCKREPLPGPMVPGKGRRRVGREDGTLRRVGKGSEGVGLPQLG